MQVRVNEAGRNHAILAPKIDGMRTLAKLHFGEQARFDAQPTGREACGTSGVGKQE